MSGPYVALGDSYTSGLQIQPQVGTPAGCARSGVNYPSLVAKRLNVTKFTDVSCSGARTYDLTAAQQTSGGANPPQLDAITSTTVLVTIGIGGNDAGFSEVLGRCVAESLRQYLTGSTPTAAPCSAYYANGPGRDEIQNKTNATGDRLGNALREIKRRAPQAKVLLIGYPALLPSDPAVCRSTMGLTISAADLSFLAGQEQQLNAMLKRTALAAGVEFVDTYGGSVGHDMCAGPAGRWVEPPAPADGLAPIHPNAAGQQGMAGAVLNALGVPRP